MTKTYHVDTAEQAFDILRNEPPRVLARSLGDMTLMLADPPLKMLKALTVISIRAYDAYDECSGIAPGGMGDKCLFASLAIRDFLVGIGYTDATVRGCALYIDAVDLEGKPIWSVGIGVPGQPLIEGKFNGHAVCTVPSLSLLIDATVHQAIRPQWLGYITSMAAIKYHEPWHNQIIHGCPSIAGGEITLEDRTVGMMWLDRPDLNWKRSEDFRIRNERRRYITKALRETFGNWRD